MYEMSPKDRREAPEAFFSVLLQETKGTPRLEVELLNKKKNEKKSRFIIYTFFLFWFTNKEMERFKDTGTLLLV